MCVLLLLFFVVEHFLPEIFLQSKNNKKALNIVRATRRSSFYFPCYFPNNKEKSRRDSNIYTII